MIVLSFCTRKNNSYEETSPYLNQHDSVQYVGMETCRLCHADKFETYMHTGMGLSFNIASPEKTSAVFQTHAPVYDSVNDFFYKPFFDGEVMKILEFRLEGKDTTYKREEVIAYIIGSGQHTNSHLVNFNGYIYQAPITFYTQRKKWDMAPGMEAGYNSRYTRMIETECMNCHNGYPVSVQGSINKYEKVAMGIDCERCHGPGSLHVANVSAGNLIDTARMIDYTIVNPRKLTVDLQNQLCLRCHLQGINVLNTGSTFFDFKPGDYIADHWNIFLPRFDGKNDQFLMASQAERLEQSKCYVQSQNISCITCHNPHITVKQTPSEYFNNACLSCHTNENSACRETSAKRSAVSDNCVRCHMPQSEAIDIPHVSITDHKIQIPGKEALRDGGKFTGLQCLTTESPSPVLMAQGYLAYYESFVKDDALLDSVITYLSKTNKQDQAYVSAIIQYHYLKNDYDAIISYAPKLESENGWDYYRVGEAFLQEKRYTDALAMFEKAVLQQHYNLDFQLKLGSVKFLLNDISGAEKIFRFILNENPKYTKAWYNLAIVLGMLGDRVQAENMLLQALLLDPDYQQARLSLVKLYMHGRQKQKAKEQLQIILKLEPANNEARTLLKQLNEL
jgi:Tfp pilus assembly protein PilF